MVYRSPLQRSQDRLHHRRCADQPADSVYRRLLLCLHLPQPCGVRLAQMDSQPKIVRGTGSSPLWRRA